ncbi:hypothetical protein [Actinoplanes derwentensis]|uniref:Uncharacterized protein n=1 Tax=Actinoplanes derwentensis TaxID=113562 RepID=A0A1H1QK02_9ACTN|nr:hypothetical protein [Actinoplanes derwentensis]GID82118.1 hypothetical protein Ade03nite_10420 [Actinoplanes derwentensis]SDS23780.1 hypothetical protein SAMN04489716_0327 [Actinoplanes derwentensis]
MIIDMTGIGSGVHYLPLGDFGAFSDRKIDKSVTARARPRLTLSRGQGRTIADPAAPLVSHEPAPGHESVQNHRTKESR